MKSKLNSLKIFAVSMALFVGVFAQVRSTEAQNFANSNQFMRNYCVNVNAKIRGLEGLIKSLKALVASIKGLNGELGSFNFSMNPPSLCLPDVGFGAGIKVPGMDALASCLGKFSVSIQTPDFSNVTSCVTGLLKDVNFMANFNISNFNPQDMLSCLGQLNTNIDFSGLANMVTGIAKALAGIVTSLQHLMGSFDAKFDANFFAQIKALARLCKQAGFK